MARAYTHLTAIVLDSDLSQDFYPGLPVLACSYHILVYEQHWRSRCCEWKIPAIRNRYPQVRQKTAGVVHLPGGECSRMTGKP